MKKVFTSKLFTSELVDNILILMLSLERVDMYNVMEVINEAAPLFNRKDFIHVIIEAKSLIYIDATAIGALMVAEGRLKKFRKNGDIYIVTEKSSLLKIKELVKLGNRIFSSREEALGHIQGRKE